MTVGHHGSDEGVQFWINNVPYKVSKNVNGRTMLADFIRNTANLKGTKIMCREGGCGACVVNVKSKDPVTGKEKIRAVNSCLTPVLSAHGWQINTIESLGNKEEGYDKIQQRLVGFHGTQCGFCTPGMIMNMKSLIDAKGDKLKCEDVEQNLDGNICRCTGYRPILDAFKSFCCDAPENVKKACADIEDLPGCPCADNKSSTACCKTDLSPSVVVKLENGQWVAASSLQMALAAMKKFSSSNVPYKLVVGNTGTGVYKYDAPVDCHLNISNVAELKRITVEKDKIKIGAAASLSDVIDTMKNASNNEGFEFGKYFAQHVERVANKPVRDNGSIGGNLMIKHNHQDFPSDLFVLLNTLDASVTTVKPEEEPSKQTMEQFLELNMENRLLVSVEIPQRVGYTFRSFKITKRYQNAHAYVNAGFLFKLDKSDAYKVSEAPRICMGGLGKFVRAYETEKYLTGKALYDLSVIKESVDMIGKEVSKECTADYQNSLSKSLLYKAILGMIEDKVEEKVRSGGRDVVRSLNKGKQKFDIPSTSSALNKPIPKIEGFAQASGEAEYTNDIPSLPNELFGAFVLSNVACAEIKNIDASKALQVPGVVRFISAEDIPGLNDYSKYGFFPTSAPDLVFATTKIFHHSQPVGMVVAETREIALEAVKKVVVTYANIEKPIVEITDAVKQAEKRELLNKQVLGNFKSPEPEGSVEVKHELEGELRTGSQYHFFMETHNCLCVPTEDGMDIFPASQWLDNIQGTVAAALRIPESGVNVRIRRLGGGFGGKLIKPTQLAVAGAVAAHVTRRPVRIVLDIEDTMKMMGKRLPYILRYKVGFDDAGRLGRLTSNIICDAGFAPNEPMSMLATSHMQSVYKAIGWDVTPHFVTTDTPSNTACRAPGSIQGMAMMECIMEHIAHKLNKDPFEVRQANFIEKEDYLFMSGLIPVPGAKFKLGVENVIPQMYEELKNSADVENRKRAVQQFNRDNRWKKRGLSIVPVRYPIDYFGKIQAQVVIYHHDGTLSVSTAGIEMGQGLNTKVAQTCSDQLGVPVDKIRVKASNNFVGNNAGPTGGSIGSEMSCYGALKACQELKERLKPFLENAKGDWVSAVEAAHQAGVELSASHSTFAERDEIKGYSVWVIEATEVEIDVLTGEYNVLRTDIVEDCGKSLSPGIDLGQIEGGHVFGQGLWTTEKIEFDKETGEILTKRTWDYKPPESKDIPEEYNVTILSNAENPFGVLNSKATGEPVLCASVSVLFAIKNAIDSARRDVGNSDWYQINAPWTPEEVQTLCLVKPEQFSI